MAEKELDFNAYKEIYQFAAAQVSESRTAFERYYKLTIGGMLLIASLTIGAFFWLVGKEYKDIAATVEKKTDTQIAALEREIRDRVDQQFKTENMRALIREVAIAQTKAGLSDLINRAVVETVERRVKAEEPQIKETVATETKKAVSGLGSTIEAQIHKQATEAENRIQARIAQSEQVIRAGNLAILARNGLATAYDELMKIAGNTSNSDIQMIAVTTRNQLYLEMDTPLYTTRMFKAQKSKQELLALLDDQQPLMRKAAIDSLVSLGEKSVVAKLLQIQERDPFIVVRQAAYRGLKSLTGQEIDPLAFDQWSAWWSKNKDGWPK